MNDFVDWLVALPGLGENSSKPTLSDLEAGEEKTADWHAKDNEEDEDGDEEDNSDSDAGEYDDEDDEDDDDDNDDDGAEDFYGLDDVSDSDSEFESDYSNEDELSYGAGEYTYTPVENGLFFLQHEYTGDKILVLARETHPLCRFVRAMQHNEKLEINRVLGTLVNADEEGTESEKVPGFVAEFVATKLHREPRFASRQIVDDNCATPTEGTEFAQFSELAISDADVDVEHAQKLQTLMDINSGAAPIEAMQRFELSHNAGNMKKIEQETSGLWYVVKTHYYAMWRSFERLHSNDSFAFMNLHKRMTETSDNSYLFPVPEALVGNYTPKQEKQILENMLEVFNQENSRAQAYASYRQRLQKLCADLFRKRNEIGTSEFAFLGTAVRLKEEMQDAINKLQKCAQEMQNFDAKYA